MEKAFIVTRGRKKPFDIPSRWDLQTFALFEDRAYEDRAAGLARSALENPVGSTALPQRISSSDTVAVLVEDLTRASPKEIILKAVLEDLEKAGVPDGNISVVIALGTHRGLTREELKGTFGTGLLGRYRFINHDCRGPDLVAAGRLRSGRTVKINRAVHQAEDCQDQPGGLRGGFQDRDRFGVSPSHERVRGRGEDPFPRGRGLRVHP